MATLEKSYRIVGLSEVKQPVKNEQVISLVLQPEGTEAGEEVSKLQGLPREMRVGVEQLLNVMGAALPQPELSHLIISPEEYARLGSPPVGRTINLSVKVAEV